MQNYSTDILIIGAGPAGLTAAIYAARSGKKTLVLGRRAVGLAAGARVRPRKLSRVSRRSTARSSCSAFREQARGFGAEFVKGDTIALSLESRAEVRLDLGCVHRSEGRHPGHGQAVRQGAADPGRGAAARLRRELLRGLRRPALQGPGRRRLRPFARGGRGHLDPGADGRPRPLDSGQGQRSRRSRRGVHEGRKAGHPDSRGRRDQGNRRG